MRPLKGTWRPIRNSSLPQTLIKSFPILHYLKCYCSVKPCPTLCNPMDCSTPGFPVPHHLPECAQTHVHCVGDAIQPSRLCHPLLPLSVFSGIRVFSNESALHIRWLKYWGFSFSINFSSEYSRLTAFRIDWFELLAVKGTLESLLQYHNLEASILQLSAFFMVQLSLNETIITSFSSVQFSRSVVSDSLQPHELQHARPPCPSQTPGVYSNSCPLSRWCHPAISSSVVPFSSCP